MQIRVWAKFTLCGFSAALLLLACQKPDVDANRKDAAATAAKAHFKALRGETFKLSGAADTANDVSEFLDGFSSPILSLSYNGVDFDEKLGAAIVSDLEVMAGKDTQFGLRIKTTKFWGLDTDALNARLSGNALDQSSAVLKRAEFNNISFVGLEGLFNAMIGAGAEKLEEGLQSLPDDTQNEADLNDIRKAFNASIDAYNFSYDTIILTDLKLHPYVLRHTPVPFADENVDPLATKIWHGVQTFAAWSAAIEFEDLAAYDGRFDMTMTQMEQPLTIEGDIALAGLHGYRQGDVDYSLTTDLSYQNQSLLPSFSGAKTDTPEILATHTRYGEVFSQGRRLAKAMEHFARVVMPDRSDTDFMSFGTITYKDAVSTINGNAYSSLEYMHFDMSRFHWLIPETIDFELRNMTLHIDELVKLFASMEDESLDAKTRAEIQKYMGDAQDILEKRDLQTFEIDFGLSLNWDGETGQTRVKYGGGAKDFFKGHVKAEAKLPDYEAIMAKVPADLKMFDAAKLGPVFADQSAFTSYESHAEDLGGIDKVLGAAIDVANILPETANGMQMFKMAKPEQLRSVMAFAILAGGAEITQEFPEATDYINAYAQFIAEGGALTLKVNPAKPLDKDFFDDIDTRAETNPQDILDAIGLSIVHEPPKK